MKFNEQLGFKTSAGIRASIESIDYYPFHSHHTYIELICVLKGNVTLYDSAVSYELHENEIHIMNSSDPHKIISKSPDNILLTIHIDKTKYSDQFKNLNLAYFVATSHNKDNIYFPEMKLLRFHMAQAYLEYISATASNIQLDYIANQILSLLFDEFHDYAYCILDSGNYNIVRRKYDGRNENEFYRVYRIADYIETNFRQKIQLSEIAENEFLSIPFLSQYIKKNIGITFSQLLSIARCSEAEKLLSTTNKSVEQIACDVGFVGRSHLFKHFTRWFSKSPSEYRKTILADLGEEIKIKYGNLDIETGLTIINKYLNA